MPLCCCCGPGPAGCVFWLAIWLTAYAQLICKLKDVSLFTYHFVCLVLLLICTFYIHRHVNIFGYEEDGRGQLHPLDHYNFPATLWQLVFVKEVIASCDSGV